jgi:hypothetical protein
MIGARCADLIAEAVVSMEFKASAEDISRMSHILQKRSKAALAATDIEKHTYSFYDFTKKTVKLYLMGFVLD